MIDNGGRRIAEGGDLALLFPLQDVGFRYPQRCSGSTRLPTATAEWLTTGRRVPHAWMTLGDDDLLISTVHLPAVASELKQVPAFVVLCHPSSKEGWQALLHDRSNWMVVSVSQSQLGDDESFDVLQSAAVRPMLEENTGGTFDLPAKFELWADLSAAARADKLAALSTTAGLLECTNVDDEWFKKLCLGRDGTTVFDVILRPDGHIAELCQQNASASERQQALENV